MPNALAISPREMSTAALAREHVAACRRLDPLAHAGNGQVQIPIITRADSTGLLQLLDARDGRVLGLASTPAIAAGTKGFFA